jgi:hypothetical protein
MKQTALLPLRKKICCGFFSPEKSDGFGRVRTRYLGYQRPTNYGTKRNIQEWKERTSGGAVTRYIRQGVAAKTGHGKVGT